MKKRKALHWEKLENGDVFIARHGSTMFYVEVCENDGGKVTRLYMIEHGVGDQQWRVPWGDVVEEWEGKNTTLAKQRAFDIATR